MTFDYWFMFPISILIATTAMATGIEGGTFFTPLFILALGLPPEVAIPTGVITETFGFSSGLFAYFRRKLIDYRLGGALLLSTIPMALIGVWLAGQINPNYLKLLLGIILLGLAIIFLRRSDNMNPAYINDEMHSERNRPLVQTCIVTAEGEEIRYPIPSITVGRIITGIGGLFIGMISTGQGQFNGYFLLKRSRLPSKVAVATSVMVVALTAMTAAVSYVVKIATGDMSRLNTVLSVAMFTVPGVLIGGQIGPLVACRLPYQMLVKGIGVLIFIVGAVLLYEVFLFL